MMVTARRFFSLVMLRVIVIVSFMDCIFCKVINKEAAAKIVYEDEEILGFENIHPEAPIHLLLIPKNILHGRIVLPKKI